MKNRWIIFGDDGGEVIKGAEPVQEPIRMEAPVVLPLHIPMHYWKLVDGQIVEMNDEEKKKSDELVNNSYTLHNITKLIKKPEVHCEEPIKESNEEVKKQLEYLEQLIDKNKAQVYKDLQHRLVSLRNILSDEIKNLDAGSEAFVRAKIELVVKEFESRDEKIQYLSKQTNTELPKLIQDGLEQIKNSSPSYKDLDNRQELMKDLVDKSLNQIEACKKQIKELQEDDKKPKIEKFYIINNFGKKEFLQIAGVSSIVYLVLHFLSYYIK